MNLHNKQIVLGVTGGIAAYKTADLASRLVKAGAIVDVVMTDAATRFVAPMSFQALTQRPVLVDMFRLLWETDITHVSLGQRADLMIIAPASANTLAKLAHGLADNLLTTTALALRQALLIAPAMETGMWVHPATQTNVRMLQQRGVFVIGPEEGRLASGGVGAGRMAEPADILDECRRIMGLHGDLGDRKLLITAGGTRERLDPVRFLGNRSSGKMGYALATAARDRGANVVLVSAPTALTCPRGVELLSVETADAMREAVMGRLVESDALIMAAAVADYRPASESTHKIKKDSNALTLELESTRDILGEVASVRETAGKPLVVVGFAAETRDVLANARAKLARKRLDMIVANDVLAADSGFEADTNRVVLITGSWSESLPLMRKEEVAHQILNRVRDFLDQQEELPGAHGGTIHG